MKLIKINKPVIFFILGILVLLCTLNVFALERESNDCNFAKAKASLFQEAINEFGAMDPESAALLWAKGVKTRNGALQYAVMSTALKKEFANKMEGSSWVTGVSSPWVEQYYIVDSKKVNDATYKITVRLELMTSAGSAGSYDKILTIEKENPYENPFWGIESITPG